MMRWACVMVLGMVGVAAADEWTLPTTIAGLPAHFSTQREGTKYDHVSVVEGHLDLAPQPLKVIIGRKTSVDAETATALKTGDAAFDAAYHVEGAPSDLVKTLLDDGVRQAFVDAQRTIVSIDETHLWTETPRMDSAEAQKMVALATVIATRLQAGLTPAAGVALTPEQRAAELAGYDKARSSQRARAIASVAPLGLVGLAVMGLTIFSIRRRRRG